MTKTKYMFLGSRQRPSTVTESLTLVAEANHLEASKFSLYVGNNAGVFQPANQNHAGIFFAQIWNQRIEESLFK